MNLGVFPRMDFASYCAIPALNKSGIDQLDRSPLHYWNQSPLNPFAESHEETASMRLGTAAHVALMEPDAWDERFIVAPEGVTFATKEGKAIKAIAEETGKTPLSFKDAMTAKRTAERILESDAGSLLFRGGMPEVTLVWQDLSGVFCKARVDYLLKTETGTFLVDLKTTKDASFYEFSKSCANYNYHRQAAWYLEGYRALTGEHATFIFAAIESEPPNAVAFYEPSDEMIIQGMDEIRPLIRKFQQCRESGIWPGYSEIIEKISLPAWKTKLKTEEF